MNLKERIINLDNRDYHMHTSSFSDGIPTVNELVKFAGEIGLKEIAITDHSQAAINVFRNNYNIYSSSTARYSLKRWGNVYNDVNVIFGVEGDLLNDSGDVCFDIQGHEADFTILSAHKDVFKGDPNNITNATIKAIENNYKRIKFIGHPCNNADFGRYYNIKELVSVANEYSIPLEFNAKNLYRGKTNLEKLDYLLKNTDKIYLNSDAHTLLELRDVRKFAISWLEENGYI